MACTGSCLQAGLPLDLPPGSDPHLCAPTRWEECFLLFFFLSQNCQKSTTARTRCKTLSTTSPCMLWAAPAPHPAAGSGLLAWCWTRRVHRANPRAHRAHTKTGRTAVPAAWRADVSNITLHSLERFPQNQRNDAQPLCLMKNSVFHSDFGKC